MADFTTRDWAGLGWHQGGDWKVENVDYGGKNFHVFEIGKGYTDGNPHRFVIVDENLNIVDYQKVPSINESYSGGWREWFDAKVGAKYGSKEQMSTNTVETAPNINYSDFAKYLDNEGNVANRDGLMQYLRILPQFKSKTDAQLIDAIGDMPKLNVSEVDMRQAQQGAYTDIYGIQQDIGQDRAKAQSEVGMSGVSSPTSTSFGGTGETFTEGLYGQAQTGMSGMKDAYGLTEGKEEEFATWLSNFS